MTPTLHGELRERFRVNFPKATDCSDEDNLEFNRLLESRLEIEIENESDAVLRQENEFVEDSPRVNLRPYANCDSWVRIDRHIWSWGRYVYLRLIIRIGADERAIGAIRPSEEIELRERAVRDAMERLTSWGDIAYFRIRPEAEDAGAMVVSGLFLVDPLALNLVGPDEQGRAIVTGTRFHVTHLVRLWQWAQHRSLDELRSELYEQLSLQQIHAAFAYWHLHHSRIESEMQEENALVEAYRREHQALPTGS